MRAARRLEQQKSLGHWQVCGGEVGNRLARFASRLILLCEKHSIFWTQENPTSCLFLLPPLRLGEQSGVEDVCFDMCQYGLCDPASGLPYRKVTRLLGRLLDLGKMAATCDGSHQHQHVEDSTMLSGRSDSLRRSWNLSYNVSF